MIENHEPVPGDHHRQYVCRDCPDSVRNADLPILDEFPETFRNGSRLLLSGSSTFEMGMSRDWGDLGDFTEMKGFKKFPELGDLFGVAKPRNKEYDGFVKSVELTFTQFNKRSCVSMVSLIRQI